MRFNRKPIEWVVLLCLLVATTLKSGSRSWAHAAEATVLVLILVSMFCFIWDGRRTRH